MVGRAKIISRSSDIVYLLNKIEVIIPVKIIGGLVIARIVYAQCGGDIRLCGQLLKMVQARDTYFTSKIDLVTISI